MLSPAFRSASLASLPSSVILVLSVMSCECSFFPALSVIFSFPVAGCLIYYFVEVFPNSREHRSARKAVQGIARTLEPDAELKRRMEEVEVCGSVDNKSRLAEECIRAGMFDDAVRLYSSCITGVHANEPDLLFGMAGACLYDGQLDRAQDIVDRLQRDHASFKPAQVQLLQARILEARGATDAALEAYEKTLPAFVGLEARCRYGLLLQQLGHVTQANFVFREIVTYAKRTRISHDSEQEWADLARRSMDRNA